MLITMSCIDMTSGHIVCLDCAQKLIHCPVCRMEYDRPLARNVLAEELIGLDLDIDWNCRAVKEVEMRCTECREVFADIDEGTIFQCWWGDLVCEACLLGNQLFKCRRSNCQERYKVPWGLTRNLVAEKVRALQTKISSPEGDN